jgi:hypothetical protein
MADLVPFTMLSAVAVLDSSLPGWTLLDVPADQPRVFLYEVAFERPFVQAPLVHVGVSGFDIGNHDAARLRVSAVDIHADGFTLRVETWLNTQVWRVDVSWLAVGSA